MKVKGIEFELLDIVTAQLQWAEETAQLKTSILSEATGRSILVSSHR